MDTVANILNSIKIANKAMHETAIVPSSKYNISILECLKRAGFISEFEIKNIKDHDMIEVKLVYRNEMPRIEVVKRISKPSRRIYASVKQLRPVRNGFGSMILSTPKGVLTEKEAKKEMVGGEVICLIW